MREYSAFSKFILRTPLLSFSKLELIEELLNNDFSINSSDILNETILEAILIASPDLYESLVKPEALNSERNRLALYKYLNRMSTRSTPFGLFSSLSVGELGVGDDTKVILDNKDKFKKFCRIDSQVLVAFYHRLFKNEFFIKEQSFVLNETLYEIGSHFRLIKTVKSDMGYSYELVSIKRDQALDLLFVSFKKDKCLKFSQIKKILKEFGTGSEILEYVTGLLKSDFIRFEKHLSIFETEILEQLIDLVKGSKSLNDQKEFLLYLDTKVTTIKKSVPGSSVSDLLLVIEKITSYFNDSTFKYLVQVDLLSKTNEANISLKLSDQIYEVVVLLNSLNPILKVPGLDEFKREFIKRFEEREVSLSEVLDVEIGIGFPNPNGYKDQNGLINGINFNSGSIGSPSYFLSASDTFILNKYHSYLENDLDFIDLSDYKLNHKTRLSDTIFTQIELLSNKDNLSALFINAGGSSAATYLSRFSYLDKSIENVIVEVIQAEQKIKGEEILAEIGHIPQPRVANILLRPCYRDYQILYGSNSTKPKDKVIELDDMMVSVKNGKEIVLRSRKLNKRINPYLTSAHNHQQNNLPVYQFLTALQFQNSNPNISFHWPNILVNKPYLPRVVYKEIVLFAATWNFSPPKSALNSPIDFDEFKKLFFSYAEKYKLPNRFFLIVRDNRILINLKLNISLKVLYRQFVIGNSFKLIEFLYDLNNMVVSDVSGDNYLNEAILLFKKNI